MTQKIIKDMAQRVDIIEAFKNDSTMAIEYIFNQYRIAYGCTTTTQRRKLWLLALNTHRLLRNK